MSLSENSETNSSLGNEEDYHKILQELDQWRSTSVKIAIIGQSGVGKSTFINKFRGLTPRDKQKVDSEGTVWKSKNFSVTQILREIIFYNWRTSYSNLEDYGVVK